MTFADLQKVEQLVGEFCHGYSITGLPAALSTTYDRVDVDLAYCRLRADLVRDWLVERTRRLGFFYDFWCPDGEPHRTLCVSERGADE